MRMLAACALGLMTLLAAPASAQEPARLDVIVLQGGGPLADVALEVDGETLGVTDADGGLAVTLPAGRHDLRLLREGETLRRVDLLVDEGEIVQLLADVRGDGARIDIESSGDARVADGEEAVDEGDEVGALSGRIVSADDGSPIAGAQVYFAGLDASVSTDEDGRYEAEVPAGAYQVSVVHPDYSTQTLDDVRVIPDRMVETDIELSPAGVELAEYVVTAPYVEGSVASVFSSQRDAASVVDVLGAEQMSRSGDSSAADALQRVTGLTIEDGKFVVVRGAPSRYTQTLWNGSPLPSPDPIKRIVPLDLFPTGVLSNISVSKSYDASQPGAFGSGQIDLRTTGMPESAFVELSASSGANSESTGEDGFNYEGGGTDFLGSDDGTRELPGRLRGSLGGGSQQDREAGARGLSNTWDVDTETLPPDAGLGVSAGGRFDLLGGTLGLNGNLDWSRDFRRIERINRSYALRGDGSLALRDDKTQRYSDMSVDFGGLLGARLEWAEHALASNTFAIRKTKQRAEITEGFDATSDDRFAREFLLDWNERELLVQQLTGEHDFGFLRIDWRGMLAESTRDAPDRREYIYLRNPDGNFVFFRQNGAERRWSESEDAVTSFDVDFTVPVLDGERVALELQTGLSTYTQERQSETRRLGIDVAPGADLGLAPETLLDPANIGDTLSVSDDTQTNDNYLGDADVDAVYLKADLDLFDRLRIIAGARLEQADFLVRTFVAGGSAGGQEVAGDFDTSDVLPSLAVTWRFAEDMQLRGTYGMTLARPVLNELSPARYYDPDTGEEFLGNPELAPTEIANYDLRWEWYPTSREQLSAGLFYKDYTNPIEQTFTGVGGSDPIRTNQNAESAEVSGVELSARTDFTRLLQPFDVDWAWTPKVYAQANAAFIESEVQLAARGIATNTNRTLQGQADQVFNLQLGYEGQRNDWTLSVNHVGQRLQLAGRQGQPDVFQEPITIVDVKYSFAWTESLTLELTGGNLLDAEVEWLQGGRLYRGLRTGIDLGAGLKYRF